MRARELLISALLALAAGVAWTWPLAQRATEALPCSSADSEPVRHALDGSAWTLWWWKVAAERGVPPLFCPDLFWPAGLELPPASDAPLTSFLGRPLVGALGTPAALNVLLLALCCAGLWMTFVLARCSGLPPGAAWVAASAWAFSPLARDLLARDLLLSVAPWTPLALLALARWAAGRTTRQRLSRGLLAGVAAGVALIASWSTGVPTLLLLALLALLAPVWVPAPAEGTRSAGAWILALAGLALIARPAWPDLARLLPPKEPPGIDAALALSGSALRWQLASPILLAALLLGIFACVRERRARALAVASTPLLVLGAFPPLHGFLAARLPAANWMPEPAAWALVGALPLALAAGAGFQRLAEVRAGRWLRAGAVALLAIQAWPGPLAMRPWSLPPAVREIARLEPRGSVLSLPVALGAGPEQAWQTFHGHAVPLGPLDRLPAQRLLQWARVHADLAGLILLGREVEPELVGLDLEALGVHHVLLDTARERNSAVLAGVLDQMPRWQRGAGEGEREVLWWHRSSLAYSGAR